MVEHLHSGVACWAEALALLLSLTFEKGRTCPNIACPHRPALRIVSCHVVQACMIMHHPPRCHHANLLSELRPCDRAQQSIAFCHALMVGASVSCEASVS